MGTLENERPLLPVGTRWIFELDEVALDKMDGLRQKFFGDSAWTVYLRLAHEDLLFVRCEVHEALDSEACLREVFRNFFALQAGRCILNEQTQSSASTCLTPFDPYLSK